MTLNPEGRKKAERLLENITMEVEGKETYDITLGDIEWLALTLLESDNKVKELDEKLKVILKNQCDCSYCSFT